MAADLRTDVAELKLLHSQARRPHVQVFLSTQIQTLERKLIDVVQSGNLYKISRVWVGLEKGSFEVFAYVLAIVLEKGLSELVAEVEARAALANSASSGPEIRYTSLSNLTWEQDNERVKIYVSLEGVEEDKVESKFEEWTFEVKIHDVEGKNYRCTIPKLHKEVDPDACRVIIKPKRVIISLRKLEEEDWKDLHFKEDKSEEESKREPMDRLLEMMRNMYDDGDEDMKKTISDAWTTYRSTYKPGFKKPMTAKRR